MILIGGENLIDFIQEPGGDGHPLYRAIPGGSPYNTAKAAARQEVATGYLSPFSTDTLGALLEGELRAEGVAVLAPSSDRPTSLAVVSLSDGHARYQFYREGTAERDISAGSLAGAVPEGAVAFQIGSLALAHGEDADIWASFFLEAAGQGLFTSLDPNIRPAFIRDREAYLARLERLYSAASLIKLSDEDLAWLAPGEALEEAARAIFARSSAALLVLTLGGDGAFAVRAGEEYRIPPAPVPDLKDTVGAGDTFMGTLLAQCRRAGLMEAGALAGADSTLIRRILETAAEAAAINCGRVGCNPPRLGELRAPL